MARSPADHQEFISQMASLVELTEQHFEVYRESPVFPRVTRGFLKEKLGDKPPINPGRYEELRDNLSTDLLPAMISCHHPGCNVYMPFCHTDPAILGSLTQNLFASYGPSWRVSPGLVELEMLMCDWYAEAVGLPTEFTFSSKTGGGVLYMSATEGLLMSAVTARAEASSKNLEQSSKPIIYTSMEGHSGVEKVAMIMGVHVRRVDCDVNGSMESQALVDRIGADRKEGFLPFMCVATVGTVVALGMDDIDKLGEICNREHIWLHVDASYAGNYCICPEYRYLLKGVEMADSVVISPQKANIGVGLCSGLWLKDIYSVESCVGNGNPMTKFYDLERIDETKRVPPIYCNLQIPSTKTALSLGILFSFRILGISGIQNELRRYISVAKKLSTFVMADKRFELAREVVLPMVCFRLKENTEGTVELLRQILNEGRIALLGVEIHNKYSLRFVTNMMVTEEHVEKSWSIIQKHANNILSPTKSSKESVK